MVGVGGRDNVDPGPCCRDLNQIWHAGSPHPWEGYKLCGGHGVGVSGRDSVDPGDRWWDLTQIWHGGSSHPQKGYRLCGYVVGVGGLAILTLVGSEPNFACRFITPPRWL